MTMAHYVVSRQADHRYYAWDSVGAFAVVFVGFAWTESEVSATSSFGQRHERPRMHDKN